MIWDDTGDTVFVMDLCKLPQMAKADITDFTSVASFSWLNTVAPTIVVPGAPFSFAGHAREGKLCIDRNWRFVDQQQERLKDAPLLPLFESVRTLNDDFDIGDFDVITNRGNLRKIMAWVNHKNLEELRIDIERIDKGVLVFRRWTPATIEKHTGSQGYRSSYEKFACDGIRGHTDELSHDRVVSYNFSGLKMLVQFECDGFIDTTDQYEMTGESKKSADRLVETLAAVGEQGSTAATESSADGAVLKIERRGDKMDHSKIIELKTRSVSKACGISAELYAQAFWSQTPTFVVAKHNGGFFSKDLIDIHTLEQFKDKSPAKRVIEQVAGILHAIVDEASKGQVGDRWCLISDESELKFVKGGRGAGRLSQV